ncbi:MAG: HAMP domain-containing histidine kinase [Lachnospiraceae bacterium]|nr:HAMP domain-containing histidine kinase [Lachnospiraceae bacterium]
MKKHFYSIWFRIVSAFFMTLATTCVLIGLFAYIMTNWDLWRLLPLKMTSLSFILFLAIISIIVGTFVSIFVIPFIMRPITELSKAMQKVAKGDYTVRLEEKISVQEINSLRTNFNHMVQELSSTETLHSDFIANVSHEFKTPLATISGYATLLQDDTLTLEERDEYIEIIVESAKELSTMTGNILSLSRLENQTIIKDREQYRVDEQIRQVILRMEPLWAEKNLDINPELEPILWYGNQELTSHIWYNLLNNAVKFTPTGGIINIRAYADEKWLTVSFQDTGIGMTPEIQTRIFDKFYQGDTSHKKKGNGLGLALTRQIVTLYGGSIQLESIPDYGSTFTVQLPMEFETSSVSVHSSL